MAKVGLGVQEFPVQNLVIVIEAGKTVLSANHVVNVFSIKLERICKHEGSRKLLSLKQRYFMSSAARLF